MHKIWTTNGTEIDFEVKTLVSKSYTNTINFFGEQTDKKLKEDNKSRFVTTIGLK